MLLRIYFHRLYVIILAKYCVSSRFLPFFNYFLIMSYSVYFLFFKSYLRLKVLLLLLIFLLSTFTDCIIILSKYCDRSCFHPFFHYFLIISYSVYCFLKTLWYLKFYFISLVSLCYKSMRNYSRFMGIYHSFTLTACIIILVNIEVEIVFLNFFH